MSSQKRTLKKDPQFIILQCRCIEEQNYSITIEKIIINNIPDQRNSNQIKSTLGGSYYNDLKMTNEQKNQQLVVSLTDSSSIASSSKDNDNVVTPARVGGKASSLAKLFAIDGLGSSVVPKAYALTVDFFQPWINEMKESANFKSLTALQISDGDKESSGEEELLLCKKLQATSYDLTLSKEQTNVIQMLTDEMNSNSWNVPNLAAVRSSAPEEDGVVSSFAGAFDTCLGVSSTFEALEKAIHTCFASLWDYRVLHYKQMNNAIASGSNNNSTDDNNNIVGGFAVVVMEMIDSQIAGVAFSANPLNSDRDELVIDSSWGLGESVVDGSVTADRYIVDKINTKLIKETLGMKGIEKRLGKQDGGVVEYIIPEDDKRRTKSSLLPDQLEELTKLVCLVEKSYGIPMDIEWAFIERSSATDDDLNTNIMDINKLELKLLQARPITTLFCMDDKMMTQPGEKRKLYFDYNIISEATTTTPFTTMDLDFYNKVPAACCGINPKGGWKMFSDDADMLLFNSSTRQYMSMSIAFKYFSTKYIANKAELMDPYLSSIISSSGCNRKKYRTTKLPKDMNIRNTWSLLKEIPIYQYYKIGKKYNGNPKQSKEEYMKIIQHDMEKLASIESNHRKKYPNGSFGSFKEYSMELLEGAVPSLFEECGCINFCILGAISDLDEHRRNGKTDEIKQDYESLCGGYIGDELMETNIAMYKLSRTLPESIWKEYGYNTMKLLADRIKKNLTCLDEKKEKECDLPIEFLRAWNTFMIKYGYDGQDQLFMSCPRYDDSPELLLSKLRLNAIGHVKDPSVTQQEQVAKRRAVMAKHEEKAKAKSWPFRSFAISKIQKRNAILEHLMWIRNAPKLHLAKVFGMIRAEILRIQDKLLESGRLTEKGDIFHLYLDEVDNAMLEDESSNIDEGGEPVQLLDLMKIIKPRKDNYERALRATACPLLVDSRCRILLPDPPIFKDGEEPEEGTFIGSAVSPGIATGRVRIINNPSEKFENGEVLCAVVTGPAWTPMFASASAVVLQIGGVLQHGALCAREYGKPAVSNIDIHTLLKDGMLVSVDGNTGIVKILNEEEEK